MTDLFTHVGHCLQSQPLLQNTTLQHENTHLSLHETAHYTTQPMQRHTVQLRYKSLTTQIVIHGSL